MSSWTPAKFWSSRRQILKDLADASSSQTVAASCLRCALWCSAVTNMVGEVVYFPLRKNHNHCWHVFIGRYWNISKLWLLTLQLYLSQVAQVLQEIVEIWIFCGMYEQQNKSLFSKTEANGVLRSFLKIGCPLFRVNTCDLEWHVESKPGISFILASFNG